jgi:hypothetical protein
MFKTGTWVGASRWPDQAAHPDHWHKPIRGQVLDFCDVRAWANSIHFPEDVPHAGEVMGVALRLQAQGKLDGLTPVCWDFITHRRVLWEKTTALHPYEDDVLLWKAAKALRLAASRATSASFCRNSRGIWRWRDAATALHHDLVACLFRIAWSGLSRQCIERTIYSAFPSS